MVQILGFLTWIRKNISTGESNIFSSVKGKKILFRLKKEKFNLMSSGVKDKDRSRDISTEKKMQKVGQEK